MIKCLIADIPQTGLLCDYRADTLVTDSLGWVSNWGDPIGTNDSLYQDTIRFRPKKIIRNGQTCVRFTNRASLVGIDSIFLNIPETCSLTTTKLSVFIVCGNNRYVQGSFLSMGTGATSATLVGASTYKSGSNLGPLRLSRLTQIADGIYIKSGVQVLSIVATVNATHFRDGYKIETQTAASTAAKKGGAIGCTKGTALSNWSNSEIYRIILYNDTLNTDSVNAIVADCITRYNIDCVDSLPNNLICVGNSLTFGSLSKDRLSPVSQINGCKMAVHNYGIPGLQIGTTSTSGTWAYDYDTRIMPIYKSDPTKTNIISIFLGTNDIGSGGQSGAQTFARLNNFITAVRDSMPSAQIWVSTLIDRNGFRTAVSNFNDSIRASPSLDADRIVDFGYGSPVESRFNDYTNTDIYNADGIHLTDSGYKVIGEYYNDLIDSIYCAGDAPIPVKTRRILRRRHFDRDGF